jgi:hypothetical protein
MHESAEAHACCRRHDAQKASHRDCHAGAEKESESEAHREAHSAAPAVVQVAGAPSPGAGVFAGGPLTWATAWPTDFCAHCASRSAIPPASVETREPNRARREASRPSVCEQGRAVFYTAAPTRAFVPSEYAPPSNARRHVLVSVFLI